MRAVFGTRKLSGNLAMPSCHWHDVMVTDAQLHYTWHSRPHTIEHRNLPKEHHTLSIYIKSHALLLAKYEILITNNTGDRLAKHTNSEDRIHIDR